MAYLRIERKDADTALVYTESSKEVNLINLRAEKKQIKARLAEINEILTALGETQ